MWLVPPGNMEVTFAQIALFLILFVLSVWSNHLWGVRGWMFVDESKPVVAPYLLYVE